MNSGLLFAILLAAVACGWMIGFWRGRRLDRLTSQYQTHNRYKELGAGVFVQDVPDHALDSFLSALDVNSDTVETHLALGAAYRKKGEIERAIRVHQHLLQKRDLRPIQHQLIEFELATDYMRAGLFDRAELQLQQLIEHSRSYRFSALLLLLDIYQREKEWRKAVDVANLLASANSNRKIREEMHALRSHFNCELAADAIRAQDFLGARRALGRALQYGHDRARPQLLLAELEMVLGRPKQAFKVLSQLVQRSENLPEGLLDALHGLTGLYGSESGQLYLQFLQHLYHRFSSTQVALALVEALERAESRAAALEFLKLEIGRNPSIELLREALQRGLLPSGEHIFWEPLVEIVQNKTWANSGYLCHSCGFAASRWHWQCPSCQRWDSLERHVETV